jgi:restriction system protein
MTQTVQGTRAMAAERGVDGETSLSLEQQLEELVKNFGAHSSVGTILETVKSLKRSQVGPLNDLTAVLREIEAAFPGDMGIFDSSIADFYSAPDDGRGDQVDRLNAPFNGLEQIEPLPTLILSAMIVPEAKVADGLSIQTITVSWQEIVKRLEKSWTTAHEIPPEKWEEIVAGAFKKEGYDEVILTPRSADGGRDVIAIRKGIGTVKILGSVKAYGPGRLVRHDDVRALIGVLAMEPDSSKGIITTTSDFAPRIYTDKQYAPLMPTRLELINGQQLQDWLVQLANTK